MKAISKDLLNNILALINQGYSKHVIASRLYVSKLTESRICHQHHLSCDKPTGDRPVKLKSQHRRNLVKFVTSGVAYNAVKAAKMLSNIFDLSVSACGCVWLWKILVWRQSSRKKSFYLQHVTRNLEWTMPWDMRIRLWKIGKKWFGLRRPK